MRIVYCVAQCSHVSGGIRIIFEHVNRLAERGHQVELWTISPVTGDAPFPSIVPIRYIPSEYDTYNQKIIKLRWKDAGLEGPDVFVAGSAEVIYGYKDVPNAKAFWYLQHDEYVACVDDNDRRTYYEALRLPINKLCNSHWTQEELRGKYNVDAELVCCGIDTTLFYPTDKFYFNKSLRSLLFFYDGQQWKGADDFFNAMKIVFNRYPDLNVFAISKSTPYLVFSNMPITFLVCPRQKDLASIYSSATVFVSSSWYEGFGLPGLEAMACGVPVVTTDSGGVREYAVPEQTALVVPPRNPLALANAVIRMLDDKALRNKLIKNGLEKVKEFDWDKSIDKLEEVFKNDYHN